ncbi:MAG: hypothetical protein A2521_14900 [Deltaproteobacteria bacterium RIFOXYD12_FULL_57_12]|nr:MAG: hypothetical protein A2521_14900 [Deltaproteobacteria bacterium RIFOXYD12_FULL_57_12]
MEIFLNEVEDLFGTAEGALLRLEETPAAGPEVEELFRVVHTLKSSSAMVGMGTISKHFHLLENLLDRLRNNELAVTRPIVSFLLENLDLLRAMISGSARGDPGAVDADLLAGRQAQLQQLMTGDRSRTEPVPVAVDAAGEFHCFRLGLSFRDDLPDPCPDPLSLLAKLAEIGEIKEVAADLSRLPPYDQIIPEKLYIAWQLVLKTGVTADELQAFFATFGQGHILTIEELSGTPEDGTLPSAPAPPREPREGGDGGEEQPATLEVVTQPPLEPDEERPSGRRQSIRVDAKKLNYLVNLADEMGIVVSVLQNLFAWKAPRHQDAIKKELDGLTKLNREFQERVANVRMSPLAGLFRRFQRIARDTAAARQKQIRVLLHGAEVELDREVIEHIADPLKHMVRNCVDHGIELPEERVAKGKPAEGTVHFSASRTGGRILIQISDDGRGFDITRIRQRAVELGLARPDEPLDRDTLLGLVCSPGFSSASKVTELSGRGVGMDVVKTEVDRLGGHLAIETREGEGTTFTLDLPLTFTLIKALHIRSRDVSYLIPLLGIMTTEPYVRGRAEAIGASQRLFYRHQEEYLPLLDLAEMSRNGTAQVWGREAVVVFLDTGRRRFGLLVDEVLDPQQVVVKSLETNFRGVKGLAGATLLGDGAVALVLDLQAIEEIFLEDSKQTINDPVVRPSPHADQSQNPQRRAATPAVLCRETNTLEVLNRRD